MDEDDHALEHVAGLGEIRRVPCVSLGVDKARVFSARALSFAQRTA